MASRSNTKSSAGRAANTDKRGDTEQTKTITLPEHITVRDLADTMSVSPIDLIKELMNAGIMANINQMLDHDTAAIVAEDMGYQIEEPEPEVGETLVEEMPIEAVRRREYSEEELKLLRERPPVVTILGHVDHGKTSLLDVIRETNVQAGEAGGITQHIGAYQIEVNDRRITFLDTPGHEAFTAMRARGAQATDIAVLVVAADDGVQPQTREAFDHARAAQVPIIVAINKIDLPSANQDRVKQQLSDLGLVPEDWGGDTIMVPVSAKMKENIDSLLDMILLVADLAEFKANSQRSAEGIVIEGRLERSRGATATLLVQEGTLKVGDALVIGKTYGKIRAMMDHTGKNIRRTTPSTPVVVLGLRDVPEAGERFEVVADDRKARGIAEDHASAREQQVTRRPAALSLEDLYAQAQAGAVETLNLVLKADVQGSIEPIRHSLERLEIGDLRVKFIHEGVGNIGESDVNLAVASDAIVIGFNVHVEPSAERLAEVEGVQIRNYEIIYRLIEDVQLAMTGMLEPEVREVVQGQAVVRQVFRVSRLGAIAGVQITEGRALRNARVRVKRNGAVLHDSQVSSLKRFTEDVREVNTGYECGVGVANYDGFEEGDVLEFYTQEVVQQ
jgi:translation initiation factor IF-2